MYKLTTLYIVISFISCSEAATPQELSFFEIAKSSYPNTSWKVDSYLSAKIICNQNINYAILGKKLNETIVLVFNSDPKRPPYQISIAADRLNPDSAFMAIDDLDEGKNDFQHMLGGIPEGYQRSKTCKGLRIRDGEKEVIHIYWSKKLKKLADWSM